MISCRVMPGVYAEADERQQSNRTELGDQSRTWVSGAGLEIQRRRSLGAVGVWVGLVAGFRSVAASLLGVATSASREVEGIGDRRVWGLVAGGCSFVGEGRKLSVGAGVSSAGCVGFVSAGSETGGLFEMESLLSKGAGVVGSAGASKLSAGLAGCLRGGVLKVSVGVSSAGWLRFSTGGSVRLEAGASSFAGVLRRSWKAGSVLGLRLPDVPLEFCCAGVPQVPLEQLLQGSQQVVGQQLFHAGYAGPGYHGA